MTLEALQAHAARQADEQRGWREELAEATWSSPDSTAAPLVPWTVSKAFREHSRAAMLPLIPLHGLRHTYATLALSSGVNPRIVSARSGPRHRGPDPGRLLPRLTAGRQRGSERIAALIV